MAKKKERADGQLSALAGEFFVAAELLKRGLQTSITIGNAKAIDLLTYNPTSKRSFTVQVKALRSSNYFLISHRDVGRGHTYAFVLLGSPDDAVRYFLVPGADLRDHPERFGKYFVDGEMPGILPKTLMELGYENAWEVFS